MTEIYVDADACPVRDEVYKVAGRLGLVVHLVSNGSRPIRPSGLPNVRSVIVAEGADAPKFTFASFPPYEACFSLTRFLYLCHCVL